MTPSHLPARVQIGDGGVTRPMMMSGMEKLRNWLNRSEKVAKTLADGLGNEGVAPEADRPQEQGQQDRANDPGQDAVAETMGQRWRG